MQIQFDEMLTTLADECYERRNFVFILFVFISLSVLAVGSMWPSVYTASTVIHIDSSNILQPLMQGTAETTETIDHEVNAREILFGDKIMDEVLEKANWLEEDSNEVQQERIKEMIRGKVSVSSVGENLVTIEYSDSDPNRAYKTVVTMADLYIKEGEKAKIDESQAAYDFINTQVHEYLEKLISVEEELQVFRTENRDARPGLETEVTNRINSLELGIEQAELEIRETMIQRDSIKKQLSGEAAITISQSREGQYRSKISELQAEVETLSLDYNETYPDIVRLKSQIEDLKQALSREIERRKQVLEQGRGSSEPYVDEAILINPLYQELRSNLSTTETRLACFS